MVPLRNELWAVLSQDGEAIVETIAYTCGEAIRKLRDSGADWDALRRRGSRVARVRIEVLDG